MPDRNQLLAFLKKAREGRPALFDGGWSAEDIVSEVQLDFLYGRLVWDGSRTLFIFLAFEAANRAQNHWRRHWRTLECIDSPGWRDLRSVGDDSGAVDDRVFLERLHERLSPLQQLVLQAWLACIDDHDVNERISQAVSLPLRRVRRIRAQIAASAREMRGQKK